MPAGPARLEVGWIGRAHGLRGDVVIAARSNRPERFAVGAVLHDAADRTFEITAARPQGDRIVVHLRGVDTREAAEALRGTQLFGLPLDGLADDEFWVHELVGCTVRQSDGSTIGVVVAVEQNPAHDLLVCDTGVLVPMVFVRSHDPAAQVVEVELPAGLTELYTEG